MHPELTRGVYAAMITPMRENESVNIDELHRQIERFVDAGINALYCLGTSGEFYALTPDERLTVMKETLAHAQGTLPVCVGVGSVTTRETARFAQEAERAGANAVSVITPYFVALEQHQIERHYRTVAAATSLPVILYNIPSRTQNAIEAETVRSLLAESNIVAIKDSSGSRKTLHSFLRLASDRFRVFSGTDSLILGALNGGAWGAVSGLSNVCPRLVVRIYSAWREGHKDEAKAAQRKLARVRDVLARGNPTSITKLAANLVGQPVGPARAPASETHPAVQAEIRDDLNQLLDMEIDV